MTKKDKMIYAMSKIFEDKYRYTDIEILTVEKFKELFPNWKTKYESITPTQVGNIIQYLNLNDTKSYREWRPNKDEFYIFKGENGLYYKYDKNKHKPLADFPGPKAYMIRIENELFKKFSKKPNELKKPISRTITIFDRRIEISSRIKYQAKGHCMNCKEISFKNNQNKYYMETHHIVPLSEGGSDTEDNVIALCANCHKRAHFEKNKKLIYKERFFEIIKKLN